MAVTNAEELRAAVIDGCNKVLDNFFARRWLTDEEQQLLRAQREFWRAAGAADVAALYERFTLARGGRDNHPGGG